MMYSPEGRIAIGSWVTFVSDAGQRCSGLVIGASSNGFSRRLTVRTDLGGPDVSVHEMHASVTPPPRSKPRLIISTGERISP
jgi:hypothetical protein